MMHPRRTMLFMLALAMVLIFAGCALFKNKKELPPNRNANVVVFPVDSLAFKDLRCTQEFEKMTLSGQVKNLAGFPITDVRIRAVILYTGDFPGNYTTETFNLEVTPPVLQPSEWGSFSLTGTVHEMISHAELHASWQPFYPQFSN